MALTLFALIYRSDYYVVFTEKVSDIRLDGKAIDLNKYERLEFYSFRARDEVHWLSYRKADGKRIDMELYARTYDQGACILEVSDDKFDGNLRYRIVD